MTPGLLDLVRLQQHTHRHALALSVSGGSGSPIPPTTTTSPALLYDDPPRHAAPVALSLPGPDANASVPSLSSSSTSNNSNGAVRTLNFISVPGLTEGVDICGDGVVGREGGLSPYYHLLGPGNGVTGDGGVPHQQEQEQEQQQQQLEGQGLARLRSRSAPMAAPPASTMHAAAGVGVVGGNGGVMGTPPRKERWAVLASSPLAGPEVCVYVMGGGV